MGGSGLVLSGFSLSLFRDSFGALVVPTDPYVVWCREELSFYKALGPVNGLLGVGDARGVWMHDGYCW